jgi:fumarate reductase subunit D
MGIIAGKLYKRSNKPNFCADGGFLTALLLDISFLLVAVLIPLIAYVLEALTGVLQPLEWVLLAIYLIVALLMIITHSLIGCKKCSITDCPMSGHHKRQKESSL